MAPRTRSHRHQHDESFPAVPQPSQEVSYQPSTGVWVYESQPIIDIPPSPPPLERLPLTEMDPNVSAPPYYGVDACSPCADILAAPPGPEHHPVIKYINETIIPLGFTVSTKGVELELGVIKVKCWRGSTRGKGSDSARKHSHKTDCPFYMVLYRPARSFSHSWTIRVPRDFHNHPKDLPIDMPIARRFSKAEIDRIMAFDRPPADILATLNDEGRATRAHDLSNLLQRQKEIRLGGTTPAEAAIKLLDAQNDLYYTWLDEETCRMEGLLLSSHGVAVLTRLHAAVLIIDSTYSTNRYGLPCLHIVAKTGVGRVVTSCVVFMAAETALWYDRALEKFLAMVLLGNASLVHCIVTDREAALKTAIEKHFPAAKHLFCQWHVTCNIETNGRNKMSQQDWEKVLGHWKSKVLRAETTEEANTALIQMKSTFAGPTYAPFHTYVDGLRFIHPYILNAETDKHLNLDIRDTSPGEGEHAHVKVTLGSGNGSGTSAARKDMLAVTRKMSEHFKRQYRRIEGEYTKQRSRQSKNLIGNLGQISHQLTYPAIKLLEPQVAKAVKYIEDMRIYETARPREGQVLHCPSLPDCRNHFRTIYGLPCAHDILAAHQEGRQMTTLHVIPYWKLWHREELKDMIEEGKRAFQEGVWVPANAPELPAAILNPWMRFQRVQYKQVQVVSQILAARPRGSSQRLPTAQEVTEASVNGVPKRHMVCSGCRQPGHMVSYCYKEHTLRRKAQARSATLSERALTLEPPTQSSTQSPSLPASQYTQQTQ